MTAIKVTFDRAEKGLGYEIYRVIGSKRHLCRFENVNGVLWCTFTGEPANDVRTDLAIEILDKKGDTIAIEQNKEVNGFVFADKKFPLSWEKDNYESVLKSGMFFEFHPDLSGNWEIDKEKWSHIGGKIINKPKPAEAKLLYPPTCKHSTFFQKTFTSLTNEREYWLFTEVFCYLHKGKDFCNCKDKKAKNPDCTKCENHFSNPFDQDYCEKDYDLEADEDCKGFYYKPLNQTK